MVAKSPNLITIKRSSSTAAAPTLANGELAWTSAGNKLFIGNFGTSLAIGGEMSPGVLTANQALVANSTSFIDSVKAGNVTITGMLTANGSSGTVGQILYSDGTGKSFWGSIDTGVPATYVQNTDSRTLSGNLTLTGATTTINNLYGGNVYSTNLTSGRVTYAGASGKLIDSTNFTYDNSNQVLSVGAGGVQIGGDSGYGTVTTQYANVTGKVTIGTYPNATLTGNSTTGYFTGTSYNANNATYLGGKTESNINANSALTANNTTYVNGKTESNLNVNSASSATNANNAAYLGGTIATSYALTSALSGYLPTSTTYVASLVEGTGVTITNNSGSGATPTIAIGQAVATTSDVTFNDITANGNTVLGSSSADIITFNGYMASDIAPAASGTGSIGQSNHRWNKLYLYNGGIDINGLEITSVGGTELSVLGGLNVNTNITSTNATFYHNVSIGGDLSLTGNVVYANVSSYIVTDPLVQYAANNNLTDTLDIGFFGNYGTDGNPANHKHTGLFRDASDGVWKFFTGLGPVPTTTVDTADGSYTQATLKAYLNSGALTTNSTALGITGTDSLTVTLAANTLTLSTALATGSGGTGYKTYSTGDLLTGSGSSLITLGIGTAGQVLQVSDGGTLLYGGLDGGTY